MTTTMTTTTFPLPLGFSADKTGNGLVLVAPVEGISCSLSYVGLTHVRLFAVRGEDAINLPLGGLLPRLQGREVEQLFNLWVGLNPTHVPIPAPAVPAPAAPAVPPRSQREEEEEDFLRKCFARERAKRG